jgi:hypothetical protein
MILRFVPHIVAAAMLSVANADTSAGPSPAKQDTPTPSSAHSVAYSRWIYAVAIRSGQPLHHGRDFYDSYFEYRWKSEWVVSRYLCTVELRTTDDGDITRIIAELGVEYSNSHTAGTAITHRQEFNAQNIVVGSKTAHAFIRPTDCDRVELVYFHVTPDHSHP